MESFKMKWKFYTVRKSDENTTVRIYKEAPTTDTILCNQLQKTVSCIPCLNQLSKGKNYFYI